MVRVSSPGRVWVCKSLRLRGELMPEVMVQHPNAVFTLKGRRKMVDCVLVDGWRNWTERRRV